MGDFEGVNWDIPYSEDGIPIIEKKYKPRDSGHFHEYSMEADSEEPEYK